MIWTLLGVAAAGEIRIDAVVDPDLEHLRGTMSVSDDLLVFVDPLALWPDPEDDLQLQRTYPQAPDHGRVRWTEAAPGTVAQMEACSARGPPHQRSLSRQAAARATCWGMSIGTWAAPSAARSWTTASNPAARPKK